MSQLSEFITRLEEKVKGYEASIQQSMMNHNALLGALQSSKEALVAALQIVNAAAPDSQVAEALNVSEEVATVVENVVESVEPEQQN
jgi:hypothetical protein